ncbi:MAG: hypothetical protein A3E83_03235 [Gammaproteobacteria bacterium RIFCSPHIGHO2_12_FULL_41_20]|nr:MAG: hypothetical protein A3E83_03235 [Gammaproteobacteria bacterium RIFCSPHIGHO2_12_FULL_41_20]
MGSRTTDATRRAPFFLFSLSDSHLMGDLLLTNPDGFMQKLMAKSAWFSQEMAQQLDAIDPIHYTAKMFNVGELVPFAGHSLGPVFQPVLNRIQRTADLQSRLHEGHFPDSHPDGQESGHWFDCDRYQPALAAAKKLLGFADESEFIFTASGLSQNLGMLMDTFFRSTKRDWDTGKTKIVMLDTEFFSDQAEAISVLRRAIQQADDFEYFREREKPIPESQIIKIKPDDKGLFNTEDIIRIIRDHAKEVKMICLSDIVFSTGQRLELNKIFSAVGDVIRENCIIVGLDLAHTVGNRAIDLKSLPVTFAVGCAYKHLSGFPGSGFGFYVNRNADLTRYPPLQGWKAANSSQVFATIKHYDSSIMAQTGAVAFRASNPAPVALIPAQVFLTYFNNIGFDKCFNKSECLTRYLLAQLKYHLGDKLELITPEDPMQRGAMIVFRIKGLSSVEEIEDFLKEGRSELGNYEVDVRAPNIRMTAHYAYSTFEQICRMVNKLTLVVNNLLRQEEGHALAVSK